MKKMRFNLTQRLAIGAGMLALCAAAHAAPLTFVQSPPGTAREPAPNVIISVDDSGSMGWDVNGCQTMDYDVTTFGDQLDPSRSATDPACPSRTTNTQPSRIASLKAALRNTFGNGTASNRGIIADERIRLAWQALDDRNSGLNQDVITAGAVNSLKSFIGTHRTNFEQFVASLAANSLVGTSLHKMMSNVDAYMKTSGVNGPYANTPGAADTGSLSCRKTFHILMTDGAWNTEETATQQAGNVDGTFNRTLPDGMVYNDTAQTKVYSDSWGGVTGTIADWSMRHWSTDYQTLTNDVRPSMRVTGTETVGALSMGPYWNPKNNPMKWQGVTTNTIGFSRGAITWTGGPAWDNTTDNNYGAGYVSKANDTTEWLNLFDTTLTRQQLEAQRRASDLWHAALNGRGKYYPARTDAALTNAFQDILADILSQTSKPLVSIAASSSRLRSTESVFIAGYNSENWSGDLSAYAVSAATSAVNGTPTWRASTLLDASTLSIPDRMILTSPGGTITSSFLWGSLTTAMQADISGVDGTTTGSARLDYLRGLRSGERKNGGQFRDRDSRLGDIVNSNIWMMGKPLRMTFNHSGHDAFRTAQSSRTPTLFVGANDGMLHGFNASTGAEIMAYVPRGVYPKLRNYTLENYTHAYFVDGNPFTGDADISGRLDTTTTVADWRTLLVSGLGAGGKGYFILNVTNPGNPQVWLDNTLPADADVGHIFSAPVVDAMTGSQSEQIVKMNNGRWAVVMGNGYNSTNERPVLLVQYLDGDRSLHKVIANTSMTQTNGLSAPRLIDINGDGKVDIAYAGDIQGNMWKFNLTSSTPSNWAVAGSGPLFTAEFPTGTRQPITVAPIWVAPPLGGVQIAFGTGRNVTSTDRSSTATHTIYSLWDNSRYASSASAVTLTTNATTITGRSQLVAQSVVNTVTSTSTASAVTNPFFNTSLNDVNYTGASPKRGWYLDLPVSRERVLSNPSIFDGPLILVSSNVPTSGTSGETCDLSVTADDNYINVLNIFSGKPSKTPVFAAPDSSMNMQNASRTRFGSGDNVAFKKSTGTDLISPDPRPENCPEGQLCTGKLTLKKGPLIGERADWREMRMN